MDKLGRYKPVVVLTLILSAVFHHSLVLIPHMETPGEIPAAYVMRHPRSGAVEVMKIFLFYFFVLCPRILIYIYYLARAN